MHHKTLSKLHKSSLTCIDESIEQDSQQLCRGTLMCHKASIGVLQNFTIINKHLRTILVIG